MTNHNLHSKSVDYALLKCIHQAEVVHAIQKYSSIDWSYSRRVDRALLECIQQSKLK